MSENEPSGERREVVRVTANLPIKVFQALEFLAKKRGTSMTEQLRQAISTEYNLDWFMDQQEISERPITLGELQELPTLDSLDISDLPKAPDPEERTDY